MQFNPVLCKQSISYAYRGQTRWQKYPGWSFLFPRSCIIALAKQMNFHLTVWMLKWHFFSKCVCFHVQLQTAPCSDAHPGHWEILVFFLCQKVIYHIQGEGCMLPAGLLRIFFLILFTCVKQSWKQEYTGIFWGGNTQRHRLCSTGWPWLSPHPEPLQNLLGVICPFITQLCSYCVLICLVDWRKNMW